MLTQRLSAAWNQTLVAILAGIAAAGLTISSAAATLIEKDLFVAGDKLITLDTLTGLEWLDVDATNGLSYNAAELSPYVTILNFRHANQNEVGALYTGVGVLDQTSTYNAADVPGVLELLQKLGCVGDCPIYPKQYGWTDLVPFSATIAGLPFVQYDTTTSLAQSGNTAPTFSPCGGGCPKSLGFIGAGNYLVRPVPEPLTLAIFGVGLAGLAGSRRRAAKPTT